MMPQDCCCAGRDRTNKKRGSNTDELENQICSWDFHSTGYVGANLCSAPWRRIAGRSIGPVSFDRGGVGDLRFAFCETEIGQSVQCSLRSRYLLGHKSENGGRYRIRTYDFHSVKMALYR